MVINMPPEVRSLRQSYLQVQFIYERHLSLFKFNRCLRYCIRNEGRLKALVRWYEAQHALDRIVVNVVVLEDGITEDPEAVNTGDEVYDAKGVILELADVCDHIFTADLNPVALEHEP